ncbi:MAG: FAD:protein FMN transferase [Planctomycetota bacterium]
MRAEPGRPLRLSLVVVIALAASACSRASPQRFEYAQVIMGVEARIILYATDETTARRAARSAFERLDDLDSVMSDYRRDSELVTVSRSAGTGSIPISADLWRVLTRAQAIAAASDGAFDVTIGPLVELWRAVRKTGRLPAADSLARAKERSGWRNLVVDPRASTLELKRSGMKLDLGGIGKGFAADEALGTLADHGLQRCLVDLGGDIAAGAPPPGASGWRVVANTHEPPLVVEITGAAVAASGDTEQFVEIDGKRHSHIVDPGTGLGLTGGHLVTVIAPDAATADALASAVSVLGADRGLKLLDQFPGSAGLVVEDGGRRRVLSGTFASFVVDDE